MILYNRTKLPDETLTRVLYLAAKAIGSIRCAKVVIKVTTSSMYASGEAKRSWQNYYHGWLCGSQNRDPRTGEYDNDKDLRVIPTDCGYVFLRIPINNGDPLYLAEELFDLAAHEWQHIKDFQKKAFYGGYNRNWKNRPHERRAIIAAKRAVKVKDSRRDIQEAVINLGIAIENIRRK